jgi:hypothetical protein
MVKDTTKKPVKTLKGQVPQDQIDAWKKEHGDGNVFRVIKEGMAAYFKLPGFDELDAYHATSGEPVTAQWKALCDMLWLGGCEELITSPRHLGNVTKQIQEAMVGQEATFENL